MSTVQDEAELGPAQSTSDEESEDEREFDNNELEVVLTSPDQTVKSPGKVDTDDNILEVPGARLQGDQTCDLDTQVKLKSTSSLALARPSSADGSLSIPDDTPSIQVSESSTDAARWSLIGIGV